MEELNVTGKTVLSTTQLGIKFDRQVKKVLACKPILAFILQAVVEECRGMTIQEVEKCIEGEIRVEQVLVDPGLTNTEVVLGDMNEDSVPGEGMVRYDIRTHLILKGNDQYIKILVDVEAQKDDTPGYDIPIRGLFYCARMLSAQLGTEFSNSTNDKKKYDNIKKVYSIWICMETTGEKANTIERFSVNREQIAGKTYHSKERYDIMETIIINVGKSQNKSGGNQLLDMLADLLDEHMSAKEKLKTLESQGISVTDNIKEEVVDMTTIAASIIERCEAEGLARGMEKGMAQGMAQGMEKGMAQGMEKGMAQGMAQGVEKGIAQGEVQGQAALAEAIRAYRDGKSYDELIAKYGESTAKLAKELA